MTCLDFDGTQGKISPLFSISDFVRWCKEYRQFCDRSKQGYTVATVCTGTDDDMFTLALFSLSTLERRLALHAAIVTLIIDISKITVWMNLGWCKLNKVPLCFCTNRKYSAWSNTDLKQWKYSALFLRLKKSRRPWTRNGLRRQLSFGAGMTDGPLGPIRYTKAITSLKIKTWHQFDVAYWRQA